MEAYELHVAQEEQTRGGRGGIGSAQIEEAISDPLFEGYVRLMTAIAD